MTRSKPVARWLRTLGVPLVLLWAAGTAHAQTPAPPPAFDGFKVGSFTFKPGGRIKLDVIRDFDVITSEDSFDPRTIVLGDPDGGNSQLHARETRLTLDMRGPVEGSELRMYVETDFYGSGNVLRLRQAYGSYKGLLAGQTWSMFVDDSNFPNTIDFESPMAFPSIRQAQVRWTSKLASNASWSVAVEDNKSSITSPTGEPGQVRYPMPDLTTQGTFDRRARTCLRVGVSRQGAFPSDDGGPTTCTLWGSMLSGRLKTFGRDYAYAQFTFGDGVGRYRGGVTAVPDFNGELQPVGLTAFIGGYEHYWSSRVTTNAVFSVTTADESRTTRTSSTRNSITARSISSTGSCPTARGPASSTSTAADRSSLATRAPPIASSSQFVSISLRRNPGAAHGKEFNGGTPARSLFLGSSGAPRLVARPRPGRAEMGVECQQPRRRGPAGRGERGAHRASPP